MLSCCVVYACVLYLLHAWYSLYDSYTGPPRWC